MQLDRQSIAGGGGEDLATCRRAENTGLAEHIATPREALACDGRDHLLTDESYVLRALPAVLRRDLVRPEKRRDQCRRQFAGELTDNTELFQLGLQLEAVARFHLDRRRAALEQSGETRPRQRRQFLLGPGAHIVYRLQDAAAGRGDRLVIDAERAAFVIIEAGCAEDAVGVAIDESGEDDAGHLHDPNGLRRILATTDPAEPRVLDQDR